MAKFYGKIGYVETVEDPPNSGIWVDKLIAEKNYRGDILRDTRTWQTSEQLIDDFHIRNNQISIVADPYIYANISHLAYVEYLGIKWKITSIDTSQRPKLILTLGGEYNGEPNGTT